MPVMVYESTSVISRPVVSIIMTVHNRVDYLKQAVDSIRTQTFKDWELIVVDDGSTDSSANVEWCLHDHRVRVAILPRRVGNEGIGRVLNVGVELARGNFLGICDSDDIRYADSLSAQVSYLCINSSIGVVATQYIDLMPDGSPITVPCARIFEEAHRIRMSSGSWRDLTAWRNSFAGRSSVDLVRQILEGTGIFSNCLLHSSVMYRSSALKTHGKYNENLTHEVDIDIYRRLARAGVGFAMLPEVLAGWRLHPHRMSVQKWIAADDVAALK